MEYLSPRRQARKETVSDPLGDLGGFARRKKVYSERRLQNLRFVQAKGSGFRRRFRPETCHPEPCFTALQRVLQAPLDIDGPAWLAFTRRSITRLMQ